jgi:hypothetical protein
MRALGLALISAKPRCLKNGKNDFCKSSQKLKKDKKADRRTRYETVQ